MKNISKTKFSLILILFVSGLMLVTGAVAGPAEGAELEQVTRIFLPFISSHPTPPQPGLITGALGYPGERIPPMEIIAFRVGDMHTYFSDQTSENEQVYQISVSLPGEYVVVAYYEDLAGGYTQFVLCGLHVSCTNHSLIPVTVRAGQVTTGVDVLDWYAPPGTFPSKP